MEVVHTRGRLAQETVAPSAGALLVQEARINKPRIQTAKGDNGPYNFIEYEDGRRIAFAEKGDPNGTPVFLLHGSPGWRGGPHPRSPVLHWLGTRLISYDRPGYGDSTPQEGRRVVDCVDQVRDLADALGLEQFGIVGRSGGGPGALACAAAADTFGGRLRGVIVLGTPTPQHDRFKGMSPSNLEIYGADEQTLIDELTKRVEAIQKNPDSLLEGLEDELTATDKYFTDTPDTRELLRAAYKAAVRQGPAGWIQDALALRRDWGVDLKALCNTPVPLRFWHARNDQYSPFGQVETLASTIENATLEVIHNAAHFSAFLVTTKILGKCVDFDSRYWREQPKQIEYKDLQSYRDA